MLGEVEEPIDLEGLPDMEIATEVPGQTDPYLCDDGYRDWETDRKSTRLNSSHSGESRMPSSA